MSHLQQLPPNNLNKYDFYEYGRPLMFAGTDYRSATTRGHQFYFPREVPRESGFERVVNRTGKRPEVLRDVSETTEAFPFKFPFKYEPRAADRIYQSNRPAFVKYFDERVRKDLLKPINEYQTSNFHHYPPKQLPAEPRFVEESLGKQVERPTHITYTHEKGDAKYLDPYVSTTHLDHIPFTENMQMGIGKKDGITVWDWLQYPKTQLGFGLKDYPHKECKRLQPMYDKAKFSDLVTDREVPKRMKFVPNNCFQTETRQNYQIPVEKAFIYDKAHGQAITYDSGVELNGTEYDVIGSGKRVQSYLEADKLKILHYKIPGDCR